MQMLSASCPSEALKAYMHGPGPTEQHMACISSSWHAFPMLRSAAVQIQDADCLMQLASAVLGTAQMTAALLWIWWMQAPLCLKALQGQVQLVLQLQR